MKILIIEDIAYRKKYLQELVNPSETDWAQRAEDGLELLARNEYDLIFLDHDLIGAKSGSYLTMAWSKKAKEFATQKPMVIIHSMNMEGARRMESHLKGIAKKTERIPFKLIIEGKVDLVKIITPIV
ncbi:MAG: response regulator [Bacteroidetes bacterium]|nr:response regulator [Bacteroidota bacterium]